MSPLKSIAAAGLAVLLHAASAGAQVTTRPASAGAVDVDNYALFGGDFRAVINAAGAVVPDYNMWDVGPAPGAVAFWEAFAIKLQAPSDVLRRKQTGGRYLDQYGGAWTVRRVQVMFSNRLTSCDTAPDHAALRDGVCYFLVPEFGGYQTDRKSYEAGARVLKAVDAQVAGAVAARIRAQTKKMLADHEREKLAREKATGKKYLLPHEMIGTVMFQRLQAAILPHMRSEAVQRMKRGEFPRHRIEGTAGAWKVVFETEEGKQELAVVPGSALEKAGFALSEKYRSILDVQGKGIEDVDTLGIDAYVVNRALQEAFEVRREETRVESSRAAGEKAKAIFSNILR